MFRTALLLSLLFYCTAAVAAEGPSIIGPTEPIEPKHYAWLKIEGVDPGQTAFFFPNDALDTNPTHVVKTSGLFWSKQEGSYLVYAVVIDFKEEWAVPLSFVVEVKSPGPPPNPPSPLPAVK